MLTWQRASTPASESQLRKLWMLETASIEAVFLDAPPNLYFSDAMSITKRYFTSFFSRRS